MISHNTAISRLVNKFPNLDFSKFNYTDSRTKSLVICKIHNVEIEESYSNLMNNKYGCYLCRKEKRIYDNNINNEKYKIRNIDNLKNKFPNLDFSNSIYVNNKTNLEINCNKHGLFKATYNNLMKSKLGCSKCSVDSTKNNKDDIIEILKNKYPNYNFEKFVYANRLNKSIIICNKHGEFLSSYSNLIKKGVVYPCPMCQIKVSKPEEEIVDYIKSFYNKEIIRNDRSIIKSKYRNRYMEIDIYLPDINLAIEFNGSYWHSDEYIHNKRKYFNNAKELHEYKSNECLKQNIDLIHIYEDSYINNRDVILESIKNKILMKGE